MSHMVIYRTGDGQPGYHQAEELDEAVKFVERLRNGEGVDGARIFRMEEVSFDFRPYFKVEIGPSDEPVESPVEEAVPATAERAPAPDPSPAPTADEPAPLADAAAGDAWGSLSADPEPTPPEPTPPEPTPLVEQAAAFMPETDAEPEGEDNGDGERADEGVGARRGLFGR